MKVIQTDRHFYLIEHPTYVNAKVKTRLVQESSAVGRYDDSFDRPGSSFLWVGSEHHLDRGQVAELIEHLQSWLDNGCLKVPTTAEQP